MVLGQAPGPMVPGPAFDATSSPIPPPPPVQGVVQEPGYLHSLVDRMRGYADPDNAEIISVHQLACLIDHLDKSLFRRGQVVVKGPDVFGQNRMTQYRADFDDQMKTQLANFEIILSGYQRRADLAALTSATSIGASIPSVSNSRNVTTSTTNVNPAPAVPVPSANGLVGASGLVANANTLLGPMTPLLMPSNLTALALANKGAAGNIGIEPTVLLDERARFLNHLEQLRRINAGDDRSDLPGYGLYLVRMPVSVLPGAKSIRGQGAMVTVEAKHNLTPDLLATTFRNVVMLDTAFQLMDAVTRGQYLPVDDIDYDCAQRTIGQQPNRCMPGPSAADCWILPAPTPPPAAANTASPARAAPSTRDTMRSPSAAAASPIAAGQTQGTQGSGPNSEVAPIYGPNNLRILIAAVKQDEAAWYRHDPSVVSWLLSELSTAYSFMREQARLGNPAFQPDVFENMGHHILTRNYQALKVHRQNWLQQSADARHDQVRPLDVLAFALMVQSVFVDRQLKFDMAIQAERKGCACGDPYQYLFHALIPDEAAKQAFMAYVACKWPIHVFSLDPTVDQQNQLDLFSQRTELQLALATAIATGQANFQNATTYARRLERDLAAIALNRTAVGFGAGETTFGWRFYPRLQTPPTQSNPRRIAGILINNGPGPDYDLRNRQLEPGLRECYALMVVPNFAPQIRLTTVTNWFDLKTHHPEQMLETTDMVCMGKKLQTARNAMQRLCDSGRYRPVDVELLRDRLDQLEALLPIQSHQVTLPFEADLTGSEIFSSTNAGLAPRLLTWYGEPGGAGGSIFILGTGFTVREMRAIVGGVVVTNPDIISRNVIRIDIPANARPILTGVVVQSPTAVKHVAPVDGTPSQQAGAAGQGDCSSRSVIDVHVASPNGISNHLLVELPPAGESGGDGTVSTTVTTKTQVDATNGTTTTSTEFKTKPPGIVLPPGTYLPMGANLPNGGTFVAPGAATFQQSPPGLLPGTVPNSYTPVFPSGTVMPPVSPAPQSDGEEVPPAPEAAPSRAPGTSPAPPAPGSLQDQAPPAPERSNRPNGMGGARVPGRRVPLSDAGLGRVDPNVLPASAQAQDEPRRGSGPGPRTRILLPGASGATAPPAPSPAARKSILSRVVGGPR